MSHTITFDDRREVEAALSHPDLVPPEAPPSIGSGPTAALRDAMARFSSGELHRERRAEVERAIDMAVPAALRAAASRRTATRLDGSRLDVIADLAYHVPIEALADVLGLGDDTGQLVVDVRLVVEVIGRGAPASAASDAAAARLLDRLRHHPARTIPVASMLYQAHDATAALLAAAIHERHTGSHRSAITRTVRSASTTATIAGTPVASGTTVVLDLQATDLEFGAGPHACPGRAIAEAIVAGVIDALDRRGYDLLADLVVLDDGRPVTLPMAPLV